MNSIYPLNENDPDQDSGVQVTLGLQREPFSPEPAAKEYFYAEQTRSQRLKLLHHLAPYGELLIVTGEPGSGKTTLLQQFVERAHDTWRLCVVTAHQQLDQDQLLDALMEGFGIQAQLGDGDMEK
ncbi:MAG TPA: AAA family ATPase, partial [Gammaproteobacteria bacterium]|nr:AAA family ATPase [Gammaproteobacteria bacterium]